MADWNKFIELIGDAPGGIVSATIVVLITSLLVPFLSEFGKTLGSKLAEYLHKQIARLFRWLSTLHL